MASKDHYALLLKGVEIWNRWRKDNPQIHPSLAKAKLQGLDLRHFKLGSSVLTGAYLKGVCLDNADLTGAKLFYARMDDVSAREANFTACDFTGVKTTAIDLRGAILARSRLIDAQFTASDISGSQVYGISVWNLNLSDTKQNDLIITSPEEPPVTVDDLEVAQFIYLLLNNRKIRNVIDTITSKMVLILGRFTPERKAILDNLRTVLRDHNYLPVLFDFEKSANRDLTETITTLAYMSRFAIVDLTDAKSVPQELQAIVPNLPSLPIQPILLESQREYAMFEHFRRYPWVLEPCYYATQDSLIENLDAKVLAPAERYRSQK